MRIFYYTFGCKVNQYETENIRELFEMRGDTTVTAPDEADVCVVNSCTVTSEADKKCRQYLHRIRKLSPECVLVCSGCMVQVNKEIESLLPECDIIVGSANKTIIPSLVDEFIKTNKRITAISDVMNCPAVESMSNISYSEKTRAYIKIQDGCDMHCTYCIIPKARGHIRSKPIDDIVSESEQLIASGHKELILTGINLCCYGRENSGKLRLIDAIEAVNSIEGNFRIRLSSLEPELITDSDILRMSKISKLCPQFHLSLQSGCDRILAQMNRHYTTGEYEAICQKLRAVFPDCAITTDIMVGFPGETEDDHRESIAFAQKIGFAEAHIFPFSPRPDTPAFTMSLQLDGNIKKRRAAEMSDVCHRSQQKYLNSMIGQKAEVLFEKESSAEYHQGHTPHYVLVKVRRITDTLRRQIKTVRITSASDGCCIGELCDDLLDI